MNKTLFLGVFAVIKPRKINLFYVYEYSGAAEPPVRPSESHRSGLAEPPDFNYLASFGFNP
jgi:hypothetical protein